MRIEYVKITSKYTNLRLFCEESIEKVAKLANVQTNLTNLGQITSAMVDCPAYVPIPFDS